MPKRFQKPLESDRVILRLLEESDLSLTLRWRNQERVRSQLFTSRELSWDEHRAWFESYRDKDDDFVFLILDRALENRPVGQVALSGIDWLRRAGEFGRLLIGATDALGKGLASEATKLIVLWATRDLGLREIRLEVLKDNIAAIRIYIKHGFAEVSTSASRIVMETRSSLA